MWLAYPGLIRGRKSFSVGIGTVSHRNRSHSPLTQGRLCRSRHSSGLGPYRYNAAANFSPMALNNLNNPYSPQPSTPVATTGEDMMIGEEKEGAGGLEINLVKVQSFEMVNIRIRMFA